MMMRLVGSLAAASLLMAASGAQADSISDVENARAKDRAGYYVNRSDREKLRRYGRNDDGWRGDYGYGYGDYGSYDGPRYGGGGVSVYVGPSRGYGSYDD